MRKKLNPQSPKKEQSAIDPQPLVSSQPPINSKSSKKKPVKSSLNHNLASEDSKPAIKSDEYNSNSTSLKAFYYTIQDLFIFSKIIFVNINRCQTIDELKKKISSDISIPDDEIQFKYRPPSKLLEYINERFLFEFTTVNQHPGFNSAFRNEKKTPIKDKYSGTLFFFKNIETNKQFEILEVNGFETVLDVQKKLAEQLNRVYENIKPDILSIYDINKKQITDTSKPLCSFQDIKNDFYYKINGDHKLIHPDYEMKYVKYDFKNSKSFFYSIPELKINFKLIRINMDEIKTIDDLKRKIASDHSISEDQLFLSKSSQTELQNIDDCYDFEFKIISLSLDINILIPSGENISIKTNNTKSFNEIIELLREKGYYYSPSCIKDNLDLYNEGEIISHQGFPLSSFKNKVALELKIKGNTITLNYNGIKFIVSEGNYSYELNDLIKKAFPEGLVKIKDSYGNSFFEIKSTEKYTIQVTKSVTFSNIEKEYSSEHINVDFTATVFDVQKQLANEMKFLYKNINPEEIIIYDNNKMQITDLSRPLHSYQDFNKKFYIKHPYTMKKSKPVFLESDAEIERLKKIIEEQKTRINYLEKLVEESNKINQKQQSIDVLQNQNDKSILILNFNQINSLEKIKTLRDNPTETIYEVSQTQKFVLKIMKEISIENLKNFIKEHEVLRKLNHPNLLKTYGIFLSDETNPPSILLEHWTMNLEEKISKDSKLTNVEIIQIIYQIAEGMKYVHFQNIIHRNLNPKCIMFSDNDLIKIGEFEICKMFSPSEQLSLSMSGLIGTLEFMAPEMIDGDDGYDEKVDVFPFGKLFIYLVNGGIIKKIKKDNQVEIPKKFTKLGAEFIKKCTCSDPKGRPTFKDICDEIENKYYEMIEMTSAEKVEIKSFIDQHKERIPSYS